MPAVPYIYLFSQSPRRSDLLRQMGVKFEVLPPHSTNSLHPLNVDETPLSDETPLDYVQRVCLAKANAGWETLIHSKHHAYPVLVADTTVALGGSIIGKPRDHAETSSILRRLSGQRHYVLTAVAMIFKERVESRLSVTAVDFIELPGRRLHTYTLTDEWRDKAGAYAIQGRAAAFVRRIEGSYSGVMGLPLFETAELLRTFGYPAP